MRQFAAANFAHDRSANNSALSTSSPEPLAKPRSLFLWEFLFYSAEIGRERERERERERKGYTVSLSLYLSVCRFPRYARVYFEAPF